MIKKISVITFIFLLFGVVNCMAEAEYDGYIVKFKDSGVSFFGEGLSVADCDNNFEEVVADWNVYTTENEENIEEYIQAGLVECVSPDYKVQLFDTGYTFSPTDTYYYLQDELPAIEAAGAWSMGVFGEGVTVGVIDTGIVSHTDLDANVIGGHNYVAGAENPEDYTDNVNHGTLCASVIATVADRAGMIGVAPKAKIVALKSFEQGTGGKVSDIVPALKAAVDVYGCDIINMSFGLTSDSTILREAIDYASAKGAILIAAAGNDSNTIIQYPGGYSNVINVGAVGMTNDERKAENYATSDYDAFRKLSSISSYGTAITVVAPGASIRCNGITDSKGHTVYYANGTSLAAPMVSAIAALCKSVKPDLTHAEFEQLLIDTSEDLGDEGKDIYFGYGLVNARAAVEKLVKERGVYVSPITIINENAFQVVNNNTEQELQYADIWNKDGELSISGLTASPAARIYTGINAAADDILTHYIWDSFETLKPMFKYQLNAEAANQE